MTDWMVTLDTPQGITTDADRLVAFSDVLDELRGATGAAASLNTETGTLSATFTVDAEGVQEAVESAVLFFNAALERVGLPHGNVVHVDAEPQEDREPVFA